MPAATRYVLPMPHLESNILVMLRSTGGLNGGMTAPELADCAFEPLGRVRMTLRRLVERGKIWITGGHGLDARYLPVGVQAQYSDGQRQDFGWGRTGSDHAGAGGSQADGLTGEVVRLREALYRLEGELDRLKRDNAELREALVRRSGGGGLEGELSDRLEALLQLCHPDRHDNSERANETTRWLLALRRPRRS